MGTGFICKQPNGYLCRFSHVTESFTHINFTEKEYFEGNINNSISIESRIDTLKNHIHNIFVAIQRLSLLNYNKEDLQKELTSIGFYEVMSIYISNNLSKLKSSGCSECSICLCCMCVNKCTYPCKSCEFDEEYKPTFKCKQFTNII